MTLLLQVARVRGLALRFTLYAGVQLLVLPLNLCGPAEFFREKSAPGADFYMQMSPRRILKREKFSCGVMYNTPPPYEAFAPVITISPPVMKKSPHVFGL